MPEIIQTTVCRLEELSDAAKDKAHAWYREGGFDHEWYEFIYEDFVRICAILGIELNTSPVRLYGGGTRPKPHIYFSGFSRQGACFEGHYAYARQASAKVRDYAPQDAELHRIADALFAVQRQNFYQLKATIQHRGHYNHEHSMMVSVERKSAVYQDITIGADEVLTDALRDLARWLYRALEHEYDYQTSDECVDEALIAND